MSGLTCDSARDVCPFDFLYHKNVPHLLERIYGLLDYHDVTNCRTVCKRWCDFIDEGSSPEGYVRFRICLEMKTFVGQLLRIEWDSDEDSEEETTM